MSHRLRLATPKVQADRRSDDQPTEPRPNGRQEPNQKILSDLIRHVSTDRPLTEADFAPSAKD